MLLALALAASAAAVSMLGEADSAASREARPVAFEADHSVPAPPSAEPVRMSAPEPGTAITLGLGLWLLAQQSSRFGRGRRPA